MPNDLCPAGHPVKDLHALRCPTCGRLMPLRFARTCPNGHVVAGPARVCPVCSVGLAPSWPSRALGGAALGVFSVLALAARSAHVADRLIAWTLQTYEALREAVLALLPFSV